MKNILDKILLGDSIQLLSDIPNQSINLLVTDPPYFGMKEELYNSFFTSFVNYLTWYENWLYEANRVLTSNGSLYIFMPPLEFAELHILTKKYFHQKQIISWIKPNVMIRQPTARNYFPKVEFVGFYTKHPDNYTWNRLIKTFGTQKASNFDIQPTIYKGMQEGFEHPTQKPLKLIGKFIYASSIESDIILDPFCGVGTTCVAAKALNRRFIGIEINSKYYNLAKLRVGQSTIEEIFDKKPKGAFF